MGRGDPDPNCFQTEGPMRVIFFGIELTNRLHSRIEKSKDELKFYAHALGSHKGTTQ